MIANTVIETASDLDVVVRQRDRVDIMGINIDRTNHDGAMEKIERFLLARTPHQVVTVNVDFLNIAEKDPDFLDLLNRAALSVPDGMPILWLSRLLGVPLPERITGTDLLLACSELGARKGYSVFLLGAAEGVAATTATILQGQFPGLRVVGTYSPALSSEFDPEEDRRMVEAVTSAQPDMLFVALGTPKQEKWIYDHLEALNVPVSIGVGGVFNFMAGLVPRAPILMQRLGMEWLFRLCCEPRRLWERYLIEDRRVLMRAIRSCLSRRDEA